MTNEYRGELGGHAIGNWKPSSKAFRFKDVLNGQL